MTSLVSPPHVMHLRVRGARRLAMDAGLGSSCETLRPTSWRRVQSSRVVLELDGGARAVFRADDARNESGDGRGATLCLVQVLMWCANGRDCGARVLLAWRGGRGLLCDGARPRERAVR